MSEFIRAYDPNLARRRLRDLLFEISATEGGDPRPIPHTYETDELVGAAERATRRRSLRSSEFFKPLLLRTGIVHCLFGRDDEGRRLFDRGVRASDYLPDRALFRYAIGHWVHHRNGDRLAAKRVLLEAHEQAERGRRVRTEVEILLGRIYRQEEDYEAAERMYRGVLERGVLEFQALAHFYLTIVYARQMRLDLARQENETGHRLVSRTDDWRTRAMYDGNMAEIYALEEDFVRCRDVLERVIAERFHRLDVAELGGAYNNYALVCEQLGDLDAAKRAFAHAVRYHALVGRRELTARAYTNLARLLVANGEADAALAAVDRARELATGVNSGSAEFDALSTGLAALAIKPDAARHIPAVVGRCREIFETAGGRLEADALGSFVRASTFVDRYWGEGMSRARRLGELSSSEGRRVLDELRVSGEASSLEVVLRDELGPGIAYEDAPRPAHLVRFLLLFLGDAFKSMAYQREFGRTQSRAKYHLQWLVGRNILERVGSRKASVYLLAFHRRSGAASEGPHIPA